eukprot:scaffold2144_cov18-Tisochrysis_lutea.AAC.2
MAGMATVGVSLAEKERNYSQAIAVLRALLRGSACPGRRERWSNQALGKQVKGAHLEAGVVPCSCLAHGWSCTSNGSLASMPAHRIKSDHTL